MNEQKMMDVTTEVAKEIAKDTYDDVGRPVMKPTGELVGLIPRAIKAALSPLEKWVLEREYNVAETRKLLEEKLQNTPPELIEPPEAHIAVPAMQYISYCMDNEELREMYANLLANSMNKVVKKGVHPGFVEIIKQLSPDEAKILRGFHNTLYVPTVGLRARKKDRTSVDVFDMFTDIAEQCDCEDMYGYKKHIENILRLGLIRCSDKQYLKDESQYDALKNHPYLLQYKQSIEEMDVVLKVEYSKGYMELTEFGKAFCSICLETQEDTIEKTQEGSNTDDQL